MSSEWKPIDTAPKNRTAVIVHAAGIVGEAYYDDEHESWWWANSDWGDYWADSIEMLTGGPTHWMPLPSPPA